MGSNMGGKKMAKLIGKLTFLVLTSSILVLTFNASAQGDVLIFGPKTFTRTTTGPDVFVESFQVSDLNGKFTLLVQNGQDGRNRVSSAAIHLNKVEVISPKEFNQQVDRISKEIQLQSVNLLEVRLTSKPGAFITVSLIGQLAITVKVAPEKADVLVGQSQSFTATVTGTEDQRVTWAVNGIVGGDATVGTITPVGLYTAPTDAPRLPIVTIEARSQADPTKVGTATVIIREKRNFTQVNADNDFDAYNMGRYIVFGWSGLPEGTAKMVFSRAPSQEGPWTEIFVDEYAIDMQPLGNAIHDENDPVPADPATDYFYRMEAFSGTGQLLKRYAPVFLPKFVKEQSSSESSLLSLEAAMATMDLQPFAASTGSGPCASPDEAFITEAEFRNRDAMTLQQIREFLKTRGSFLQGDAEGKVKDVDGELIDPAQLIFDATQPNEDNPGDTINPQVLLTTLEKEHRAITRKERLPDDKLEFILGCGKPRDPKKGTPPQFPTIRQQIECAAQSLNNRFNELANGGKTKTDPPWQVGQPTETRDGITVTPANQATGALFAYTPIAGKKWGGKTRFGGNFLFCDLWHNTFKFGEDPCALTQMSPPTGPTRVETDWGDFLEVWLGTYHEPGVLFGCDVSAFYYRGSVCGLSFSGFTKFLLPDQGLGYCWTWMYQEEALASIWEGFVGLLRSCYGCP